jgi:glycosyltransferase involved in cell wall biosynthesis
MKIEFIIPTYNRPNDLMTCISSITAQTSDKWKVHIIVDGSPKETLPKLQKIQEYFKDDDRIKWTYLEKRHNDWGHTPRNIGLEQGTEEWICMTGEDNYYAPVFVEEFLKQATPKVNLIYCNMVHNWVNREYYPIKCELEYGKIDIGSFITRTKLAKQIKLDVSLNQADYKFVMEYLLRFPDGKTKAIDKVIYVHN